MDGYFIRFILPKLTSSQPAYADAVRQGGKGNMSQNIKHNTTV